VVGTGVEFAEGASVVLLDVLKDDGAGGHVDAHGKGLRGEQDLDLAAAEQNLNHLRRNKHSKYLGGRGQVSRHLNLNGG
jgi:hypothetical protein